MAVVPNLREEMVGALARTILRQTSVRAEKTVDVFIPVFNDGDCIEGVLHDVVTAKQDDWFRIQRVYVISDASTDQTDDVVMRFATGDDRIELIRKRERKGKQDSVNLALSVTNADIVVFVDADVRAADEHAIGKLLGHFRKRGTALVQGGLVRVCPGSTLNPAKLAAYFDWILVRKVRRRKSISWWSIDGRVMALARDFYRYLLLPSFLVDDQFIFYSCISQGRKFVFADDATFYYGPPETMADFSHQWSRYFFYTRNSRQYFGEEFMVEDMRLPGLRRIVLSCLARHPLCGLAWLAGHAASRVEFMLGTDFGEYASGLFWTKSSPFDTPAGPVPATKEVQEARPSPAPRKR